VKLNLDSIFRAIDFYNVSDCNKDARNQLKQNAIVDKANVLNWWEAIKGIKAIEWNT